MGVTSRATGTGTPHPAIPQFTAADVLHLILMPTEKCNFRCVYCYETFEHGRMGRPTIEGVRRLLERRAPGLTLLVLDWFGGEPLLELDVVTEIQAHALALATREGFTVRGSMTTNGYFLTPETLAELVRLGVRTYQVSLDGEPASHDARRVGGNGRGTFARVWANLLAARATDLDFEICVRTHVDRDNAASMPAYLERLARHLAGDARFRLFLRPVSRLGGANDEALPILEGGETAVVSELRRRAEELGLGLYDPGPAPACYASAANSFVVRSTGELAKCTVAFEHPANRVGRLHRDGTATLDNAKVNGWVRGLWSGDPDVLGCPMKGFADRPPAGGLPVLQ